MARIRVGHGFRKKSLLDALRSSNTGDVLLLDEGEYALDDGIFISGITLSAAGSPGRTVLRTQVSAFGASRMENLTVVAPPFKNGTYLSKPDACLELWNCRVQGEPSGKYPAVFCGAGRVVLLNTTVVCTDGAVGVYVESGGQAQATSSDLGAVRAIGSRVRIENSRTQSIVCSERSSVEGLGDVAFRPGADQWAVRSIGESVCRVQRMIIGSGPGENSGESPAETLCEDGYLEIGEAVPVNGGTVLAKTTGRGTVRTGSTAVEIVDLDAPPPPEPAPEPKEVLWRRADNRNFLGAVEPHLRDGDTLVMEEGEYFLDDLDGALALTMDVKGAAGRGRTVLNATAVAVEGHRVNLSNLTLAPAGGRNGLNVAEGATVRASDVVVRHPAGSDLPTVYVEGTFVAGQSDVGWVGAGGHGSVTLRSCSTLCVSATDSAEVTGSGSHRIVANDRDLRAVVVDDEATVFFEDVRTDALYTEIKVDSARLTVGRFTCPDDGRVVALTAAGGSAEIIGERVTVLDEEEFIAAGATVGAPAGAAQGQDPSGTSDYSGEPDGSGATDAPATSGAAVDTTDPMGDIVAMTGLETVKEQVQDFIREVRVNQMRRQRGLKAQQSTLHSMFLGNPGTGKTTVARLLGRALFDAGVVSNAAFVEVDRADLVGTAIGHSAAKTKAVLKRAHGGVLFIDEAYSLYQGNNNEFGDEAVDELLAYMENNRDEIMVIFAGYTDKMQDFLGMNPGLKSRVPNRFDFEDYTADQVADIGYTDLCDRDYVADEDLYRTAVARKYATTSDRSNGRWARNFNDTLVKAATRRIDRIEDPGLDDLTTITDEDVHLLFGGDTARKDEMVRDILAELDGLLGLEPVKVWVRHLVNRVTFDRGQGVLGQASSQPAYHMTFTGNPGTGKTTVARIVGRLFHALGILDTPTVKEVDRSDLVGTWIGHSEAATSKILDEAMGGVLFVDEAYQLHDEETANDFGGKAIDTLLPRLENDRTKFVAIFAGYTDEMEGFLGANPGLRSRVPESIEFPDYTPHEVGEMVALHLGDRWEFSRELVVGEGARRYAALPAEERSNGRWARTFADRIVAAQKDHVVTNSVPAADATRIPDALVITMP